MGSSLRRRTAGLLVQRAAVWLLLQLPVLSTRGPQRGDEVQHFCFCASNLLHHKFLPRVPSPTRYTHILSCATTLKPLIVFYSCLSVHFWSRLLFFLSVCLNILPWCDSVSVPKEGNPGKPQTDLASAPSPASSPLHSRTAVEPRGASRLSSDQPRRARQRRRTFSCSPQHWASQTDQARDDSGTSEFGLESDSSESPNSVHQLRFETLGASLEIKTHAEAWFPVYSPMLLPISHSFHCVFNLRSSSVSAAHSVSEDGQNDQYTESINSPHSSSPSSSPAARYHHGDSPTALSSSQVVNRKWVSVCV